jgi:hypothetical protein
VTTRVKLRLGCGEKRRFDETSSRAGTQGGIAGFSNRALWRNERTGLLVTKLYRLRESLVGVGHKAWSRKIARPQLCYLKACCRDDLVSFTI